MAGFAKGKRLVQLRIEYPLFFFIQGFAGPHHVADDRKVVFQGALVGLGDLIVQRPFDVVGQQGVEGEGVFQAIAFAGNGVVTGARAVHAHWLAVVERAADGALLIGVAVVLVLLVRQAQACVVGVVPAGLGQYVGGAHVFRVGGGTVQAGAVVVVVGLGFMTVALAEVQQAVELLGATCDGGGFQPAVIGGAVAGFQAGTGVLA
ncbi:hypothetical protein D3C84_410840 [compost metagenome]